MAVIRRPELDERILLHVYPKQRKRDSGDRYLTMYEGLYGKIIELGDIYFPNIYKVDFGIDLPALVRLDNLRTIDNEPFKSEDIKDEDE